MKPQTLHLNAELSWFSSVERAVYVTLSSWALPQHHTLCYRGASVQLEDSGQALPLKAYEPGGNSRLLLKLKLRQAHVKPVVCAPDRTLLSTLPLKLR